MKFVWHNQYLRSFEHFRVGEAKNGIAGCEGWRAMEGGSTSAQTLAKAEKERIWISGKGALNPSLSISSYILHAYKQA